MFKDRKYQFVPAKLPEIIEKMHLNVPYMAGKRHQLDVYLPQGTGPFPVIFDIYGGGLLFGDKSSLKLEPSLRFLADKFAIVSVDYTPNTTEHNVFPNQISELRLALIYLNNHAEQYHLNMDDVTVIGESSGAQLAVLSAASFSSNVILGDAFNDYRIPKIKRVIAMYGPYKLDQFKSEFATLGLQPKFSETGTASAFEGIMLGNQAPKLVPDLVAQANPESYFTYHMPPLMLIAGKHDHVVPYLQSVALSEAYQAKVSPDTIETVWVDHGDHGPKDYNNVDIHAKKLAFIQRTK